MAEAASIGNLLIKIGSLVNEQVNHLVSAHSNFQVIVDELTSIRAFLIKADAEEETDIVIRNWVRQVRNKSFEVEDVLDEYLLNIISPCEDVLCSHPCAAFHTVINLSTHHEIATKMKDIIDEYEKIPERLHRYVQPLPINVPSIIQAQYPSPSNLTDADFVGLKTRKEKLICLLFNGDESLNIIPIHGMAGIGKTCLARNVYDDPNVRGEFKCHGWITFPQTDKLEALLKKLLKQLYQECKKTKPKDVNTMEYDELKIAVSSFLKDFKYLIILNDIWTVQTWMAIKNAFPDNKRGSRILITTREGDVAALASTFDDQVYKPELLDMEESRELLNMRAFKRGSCPCPPHLTGAYEGILKKCGGLPLVIEAIGGLLVTKNAGVHSDEWDLIMQSFGAELKNNTMLTGPHVILSKCYYHLPHYLKPCYLYMTIFRENHPITCKKLIRLWIAEGFVQAKAEMTLEEVAEGYLSELVNKCLIQVENTSSEGKIKTCCVHSLLREILLGKSKDDNFAAIAKEKEGSWPEKIRRLSIHDMPRNISKDRSLHQLRSLIMSEMDESSFKASMPHLFSGQIKLLTVLDLQDMGSLIEFPDFITKMFNLKYLSLRNTKVKSIPSSIGKLKKLETLDLKHTHVSKLPIQILKLQLLRDLLVYNHELKPYPTTHSKEGVKAPKGLGCLRNLQKLCFVKAGKDGDSVIKEVAMLTELRRLGIIDLKSASKEDLCTSIGKLSNLRALSLTSYESEVLDLRQVVTPPTTLRRLYLTGELRSLPSWIASLQYLVKVFLKSSKLQDDPLIVLECLPRLVHIEFLQAYQGSDFQFRAKKFQNLKILGICDFDSLKGVTVDEGAIPNLERLVLESCELLKTVPSGIERLSKLIAVDLVNMPKELLKSLTRSETEYTDYRKIENIKEVNWIFKEGEAWMTQKLSTTITSTIARTSTSKHQAQHQDFSNQKTVDERENMRTK